MSDTSLSTDEITRKLALAERLADAAGCAILPHFRTADLSADNKAEQGFDPVTLADRAAEKAMRAILADAAPDDGILGEEFGNKPGTSGLTWVLDPIDGTRGFISGTPTWGVLVALADAGGPILGLIDQPYTGERFIGSPGGAFFARGGQRQPIKVRSTRKLSEAILFSTFPEVGTKAEGAAFRAVSARTRLTRYGTDCYAYALLAAGQIDLVIEAGLHPYDVNAPIAVITAAGGLVTDWEGGPVHDGGRVIAAATRELHSEALDRLHSVAAS